VLLSATITMMRLMVCVKTVRVNGWHELPHPITPVSWLKIIAGAGFRHFIDPQSMQPPRLLYCL
jgi:hypothetical protein